jgi:selenocysteine-specific elongation factor
MIIGTAGHIDHGKTALVKALTGVDTDRLPEEKRRGITIDLGFAPLALEGVGVCGLVDVPGHEAFVRSMLVGASGIDLGLLVVAADEGVMPQTREHLQILRLLEIPRLIVALTKADLVESEWLALAHEEIAELLRESDIEADEIISCSARTGLGLSHLRDALTASLRKVSARNSHDLFRLPVDRAFTVKGTGTVVTGTVWSGMLETDQTVRIMPSGKTARVRRIQQHGSETASALPGSRTAVALAGVDIQEVARGAVVVANDDWHPTSLIEAIVVLDSDSTLRIGARTKLHFHAGAAETTARMTALKESPRDRRALVRLTLDSPVTLRGGDKFILRLPAPARTIGGGTVVDPYARRRPYLSPLGHEQLTALSIDPAARLKFLLSSEGRIGVRVSELPVRIGCASSELRIVVERADAIAAAHNLFGSDIVEQVMATVQRIIAEYEIHSPLSPGFPSRTLRERLRVPEELADVAIMELEKRQLVEVNGPTVRRKGWVPSPTEADVAASNHLAHDICAGRREPPSVGELVSRYGSSVPALLHFLERKGRIVQVETDRYYDREAIDELIAKLREGLVPGKLYVPAQLRDVLGFSRKYLIPFLEFCDRSGVTERRGDGRMLRQTPGVLLDTAQHHP